MSERNDHISAWAEDVMNRKPHADFLSVYIASRVAESGRSLTMALDAEWGAGKSFFINRWADDLRQSGHGVLLFDAWKNDVASDPVLGFMAELQEGMRDLRKKVPATSRLAEQTKKTAASMVKAVRKAVVPAGTTIAAGLLKKATGIVASEVVEAVKSDDFEIDVDGEDISKAATEQLEKSLDVFFKKALEDHRARSKATEAFRTSLEKLVEQLKEAKVIDGPLYIFVDELDRCRPDYGIRLLEGIKHLFAVSGVVFVVATNLRQLGKSVQAIYGSGFDGASYLKRFFDFESTLPPPDNLSFAHALVRGALKISHGNIDYGIGEVSGDRELDLAKCFACITEAMDLPLRTQERIYLMACAAAAGVPTQVPLATLWLFFLVALRHTLPEEFHKLSLLKFELTDFANFVNGLGKVSSKALQARRGLGRDYNNYVEAPLSSVLKTYYGFTRRAQNDLMQVFNSSNELIYPDSLLSLHVGSTARDSDGKPHLFIWNYYALVKSAGHLSS